MEVRRLVKLILLLALTVQVGCASIAHSPYACESVAEKNYFYGPATYKFFGNLTQIGSCAVSKTLKVEFGDYYDSYKADINHEVDMKFTALEGYELNHFARSFNCKKESFQRFHDVVIGNKDKIFGEDFSQSPRTVTKTVQKLIDEDDVLSKLCD